MLLIQHGYLNKWRDKVLNWKYVRPQKCYRDEMVVAEETYVSQAVVLCKYLNSKYAALGCKVKGY